MQPTIAVIIAVVVVLIAAIAAETLAAAAPPAACPVALSTDAILDKEMAALAADMAAPIPTSGAREKYGPPPGDHRSATRLEQGHGGWVDMPAEYEGNSASSVLHHARRSA